MNVGDTFGLLMDKFWFSIQQIDEASEPEMIDGSTNKRRTNSELEPDSTNKKIKTEPDESNGDEPSSGDTTLVVSNGDVDGAVGNTVAENGSNSQLPSTSSTLTNQNETACAHGRIKTEPIDLNENEAQPAETSDEVVIKVEPDLEQNCGHCTTNVPVKTEIKEEPVNDGDGVATSSNDAVASGGDQAEAAGDQTANQQAQQPARRECCRYGVRCYR